MDATSPPATGVGDGGDIVQRMGGILRDEIARGALANIVSATGMWSAHRRDLIPELTRRVTTEFSDLLSPVLDLIAPVLQPATARPLPPSGRVRSPLEAEVLGESVPVLHGLWPGAPGDIVEIRTALGNDGPTTVEVGFRRSDLVAEPDGHIPAEHLRLRPGRLTVPPGAVADLRIELRVPDWARPGLYHSLLESIDGNDVRALLFFRVCSEDRRTAGSTGAARGRE